MCSTLSVASFLFYIWTSFPPFDGVNMVSRLLQTSPVLNMYCQVKHTLNCVDARARAVAVRFK